MSRVLLTGASGFVGSRTIEPLLNAGFNIVAAGRRGLSHPKVAFEVVDLLDQSSRRRLVRSAEATHLLHLAWIADPPNYWRSPANLDWAAATLDLVRLFREVGGRRMVAVGSCAEYQWCTSRFVEAETPCRPATLYGVAKDATRRLFTAFADEQGISAAWARLFYLYGPNEKRGRLVADAIAALRAGTIFPTSLGLHKRDYLHVDDAAAALVALLASGVEGPVNIASGQALPIRKILERLAAEIGNGDCLKFGERSLSASEPAIIEGDTARLVQEVGFRPFFNIASGLTDTVMRMPT